MVAGYPQLWHGFYWVISESSARMHIQGYLGTEGQNITGIHGTMDRQNHLQNTKTTIASSEKWFHSNAVMSAIIPLCFDICKEVS